jgi:hypothetical protein
MELGSYPNAIELKKREKNITNDSYMYSL